MRSRKGILVVEDDTMIAKGIKDLLRKEGYSVNAAHDGKSAMKKALAFSPNLVLLDVNLPDLSGVEVCRRLRASGYHVPIIMLTSRADQVDKVIGLESGADDYITKPFDAQEVLARVRAQLRHSGPLPRYNKEKLRTSRETGQHKLLSIMFTDIKDFAKKMNRDERLALRLLKTHNTIMNRAITRHGGRVVEVIGDAFLISFESALKAVACGVAIQHGLRKFNKDKPSLKQVRVRIGIHLGDVLEIDGKLRGDTINISARLQQIAVPGRINISESVYQAIVGKMNIRTITLGLQRVKNIRQSINVYKVTA